MPHRWSPPTLTGGLVGAWLAIGLASHRAAAQIADPAGTEPIFDAHLGFSTTDVAPWGIVPTPSPGLGDPCFGQNVNQPPEDPCFDSLWETIYDTDLPLGVLLWNATAPLQADLCSPGVCHAHSLQNALERAWDVGRAVSYIMADFEVLGEQPLNVHQNVIEMVNQAQTFAGGYHAGAKVGNYQYYPGTLDHSYLTWPSIERGPEHFLYKHSGVTIAMPACYPDQADAAHTLCYSGEWVLKESSPNVRAAYFWAPLERLSTAAQALRSDPDLSQQDHIIIPWVCRFIYREPSSSIVNPNPI